MYKENYNLKSFLKKMGPVRFLQKIVFSDTAVKEDKNGRPIFLTGIYRSGTSWVGKIISLADELIYYREPFNPSVVKTMPQQYLYLDTGKGYSLYERHTTQMLKGHLVGSNFDYTSNNNYFNFGRTRYFIKDPTAAFVCEWLSDKFNFENIILLRHPAGFVSSIIKLNWDFDLNIFLNQNGLMKEYLMPFKEILERYNCRGMTVEKGAVIWGVIYYYLHQKIINKGYFYVKYEDICVDPLTHFKEIFHKFSLSWNENVEAQINLSTTSAATFSNDTNFSLSRDIRQMGQVWRNRLTKKQIETIMNITSEFCLPYYDN